MAAAMGDVVGVASETDAAAKGTAEGGIREVGKLVFKGEVEEAAALKDGGGAETGTVFGWGVFQEVFAEACG